jgi:hypothetical protein
MVKRKTYSRCIFSPEIIQKALTALVVQNESSQVAKVSCIHINLGEEKWDYDNISEFYDDYRKPFEY